VTGLSQRRQRPKLAGFSLLEMVTAVSVVGMLLAIALPTLGRTIRVSKVSEASEQLERLYQAAAAYYAEPRDVGDTRMAHCLPAPAGPTPEAPSASPVAVDFAHASAASAATWTALQFAPEQPLRYRYSYLPGVSGCALTMPSGASTLVLRAEGDLDGDGTYSRFERRAQIQAGGDLLAEPVLHIENRME
jgi:prepilin-type N-terminal cleavage/methylation domain-containing protein